MKKYRWILAILSVSLVTSFTMCYFGMKIMQPAVNAMLTERLADNAGFWKLLAQSYNTEIIAQEKRVRRSAENVINAQAKMTYELIDHVRKSHGGKLSDESKKEIYERLDRNSVGKTGYIWILDYKGSYILSKNHERDGENIWDSIDADGNFVIRNLVEAGKRLKDSEISYYSYNWVNVGEETPREKIAALLHFPTEQWVVGVSAYYDDLVDMNYRSRTIEGVKNALASQHVGKSGYIWVVDSQGVYQISKSRIRDGENISQSEDPNEKDFIGKAIKQVRSSEAGKSVIVFPWKNEHEKNPRLKAAGLAYVEEWDWIIGVSAYLDELWYSQVFSRLWVMALAVALTLSLGSWMLYILFRTFRKNKELKTDV